MAGAEWAGVGSRAAGCGIGGGRVWDWLGGRIRYQFRSAPAHMHCYGKDLICPPTPAHHPTPAHTRPHLAQPYVDFSFLLGRAGSLFLLPCGSPARRGKSCCAPRPLLSQSSTLRFGHACWLVLRAATAYLYGRVWDGGRVYLGVGGRGQKRKSQSGARRNTQDEFKTPNFGKTYKRKCLAPCFEALALSLPTIDAVTISVFPVFAARSAASLWIFT